MCYGKPDIGYENCSNMVRERVGSVMALWRYPVKSMLGESLQAVNVTERGLLGDRGYALWDVQTSRIASAKNPKKWAKLLDFHAAYVEPPRLNQPLPAVQVKLPNGDAIASVSPDIHTMLSTVLEREVQLLSDVPDTPSLDQYWPPVEGTAHQDALTQLFMPAGTFFDSCPIHAITTATLAQLQELYPDGQFAPSRFRPNVLIQPTSDAPGFVEDAWVGRGLQIGEARLHIATACPRCVVTTLAQQGLPNDLNILKTTAAHNNVIAGIRLTVVQPGVICEGDAVWLEAAA
ncbi:MAG: MOSC domain-containing protein [Leptolyngbyaceae cyanobacterium bins.349]|nr:MOSC domain-containing protein [Leptolyngbyaceae cyanobacterium bins.349]